MANNSAAPDVTFTTAAATAAATAAEDEAKRRERIAKGSGSSIQDVNNFVKQFDQMKVMMKRFQGMGMKQK